MTCVCYMMSDIKHLEKSWNHSDSSASTSDLSIIRESILLKYPKADVVCEEVKASALTKLDFIVKEKEKEEELAWIIKENEKILQNKSILISQKSTVIKIKDDPEIDDAATFRTHLQIIEQERQFLVQHAIFRRLSDEREYKEHLQAEVQKKSQDRLQAWENAEKNSLAEIQAFEAIEKKRTTLVMQLQTKRQQEQAKKIERLIEEAGRIEQIRRDENRHKRELLEKILSKQMRFRVVFSNISDMLKGFPYREEMIAAVTSSVPTIKGLNEMMETLIKQCKVGEVSQLDLTTAENLVEKLESGYLSVKNKLDDIKQQKEAEKEQKENIAQASEQNNVPQQTPQPSTTQNNKSTAEIRTIDTTVGKLTGLEGFISSENLKVLTYHQKVLEDHLASLRPLENDAKLKKFKFQCQMAVNTPLNAISAVSSSHLRDKLKRLQNLLRGHPVEVSNAQMSASSHQLGIAFCTNVLAERIVEQGEQVVASKPESAYPIAAVTFALMTEFPLFKDLLFAHFFTQYPYLVPYYAPRTSNMTDQEYYCAQGYRYNAEGQVETHVKFLKRLTGTTILYFAILTAKLPRDITMASPPTLASVWTWLSSLLNLDPRPDVSATVLLVCLEVTGNAVSSAYPKQFKKLFIAIIRQYFPLIKQVSPGGVSGPMSRLEIFLQNCAKKSNIPPPSGTLPPNFW